MELLFELDMIKLEYLYLFNILDEFKELNRLQDSLVFNLFLLTTCDFKLFRALDSKHLFPYDMLSVLLDLVMFLLSSVRSEFCR